MTRWQAIVKRVMDVLIAIIAAIVLSPVMAFVAIAVAIDSAGPIIYGATRVGRGGRTFTMWKFRSMARGADQMGPGVTGAHDFRITRVGAFLRRTKLDELPQLANVLIGQMSLVGPRPESPTYVALWTVAERAVLQVRPGVTGPTQLAYIDEQETLIGDPDAAYESELLHAKLVVDLEYVSRFSIRGDLGILWRTAVGILTAGQRRSNQPRRRYTLAERLASARIGPMVLDGVLAAMAAALAVGLRIDRNNIFAAVATYWIFVPLAAAIRPIGFLLGGAYLRVWRYPTVADAALVISSLAIGSLAMTVVIFVVLQPWDFPGTVGFPRSAILIEFLISVLVLGGIRFASRIRQEDLDVPGSSNAGPPKPVLIYGAGEAGALLVREMRRNRALRMEPVAFLDDDSAKRGQQIYGVEVVGAAEDLPAAVAEREVAEVIVAMPRVSGERVRRIVAIADAAEIPVRILPAVNELLDQTVSVSRIRPVGVQDLLRREPVAIPDEPMRRLVDGKTVLVTGAGGSIGSELCRQLASLGASRIVLFERAETPLFYVAEELRRHFGTIDIAPVIGDVTDDQVVKRTFQRERPAVVFHAAAHKHVPLSETNPSATAWTNVRGTRLVAEAAAHIGVDAFVFVSTDKAVDPSSVMGATKRLGEELVREIAHGAPGRFLIVRFGNVMGSQGSVVEVFRQQIADGGPLTVTHPEMTRYFMTIPEAVRLILHVGAVGCSGDIHVLNMGRPIRIVDLARDLIRLSMPAGSRDIDIKFTGLRPGEKLEESLFGETEESIETDEPYLLVGRRAGPSTTSARDAAIVVEDLAGRGDEEGVRTQLLHRVARSGVVSRKVPPAPTDAA